MLLRHFFTPGLCINSYLIFDEKMRVGAVIDPTRQIDVYLSCAKQEGIEITSIIETHVHADFVSGALELKVALGGKPRIFCSGLGGKEWVPVYADHLVQDRESIYIGALRLEAWHTPGHTPEHLIWVVYDEQRSSTVPEIVFTGDLLFVGGVGRPDLLGEKAEGVLAKQLYHSLFEVLVTLPDFLEVYPAHGSGSLCGKEIGVRLFSTLGYEKNCNTWLRHQEYSSWLNSLRLGMSPFPAYFSQMKQVNVKGPDLQIREMPPVLSLEEVKKRLLTDLVIDVRHPNEYSLGNIQGSINIPFMPSFPLWAGSVLPYDRDLLLVVSRSEGVVSLLQSLNFVGFNRISGIVDIGLWSEEDKKSVLKTSFPISVEALYSEKDSYYLLDVRTASEWNAGHIAGAHHIDLIKIPQVLAEIPNDKPIAVICHSGNRASVIASFLEKQNAAKALNVKGGMQAWIQAKLPVVVIS